MKDISTCMLLCLHICNRRRSKLLTQPCLLYLSIVYSRQGRYHTQQSVTLNLISLIRPSIGGPSMRKLRSTTTSYNVTVISPSRRWNVDVSGLHLSIRAVSNGRSSLTQVNLKGIENPAEETCSMIWSSFSSQCFSDREWSKNLIIPRSCRFANKWVRVQLAY